MQFIIDMDIEEMTNQELKKAVNERTLARQEKDQALQENADLQKTVEDQSGFITGLTAELANLKVQCSMEVFPAGFSRLYTKIIPTQVHPSNRVAHSERDSGSVLSVLSVLAVLPHRNIQPFLTRAPVPTFSQAKQ